MAPEGIQAVVRHLEGATYVRWLCAVEEYRGVRRVGIAIALAGQETERDERVEKIPRAARMQAQPAAEHTEGLRPSAQLGEQPHLDGAEKCLRGPKRQTG